MKFRAKFYATFRIATRATSINSLISTFFLQARLTLPATAATARLSARVICVRREKDSPGLCPSLPQQTSALVWAQNSLKADVQLATTKRNKGGSAATSRVNPLQPGVTEEWPKVYDTVKITFSYDEAILLWLISIEIQLRFGGNSFPKFFFTHKHQE